MVGAAGIDGKLAPQHKIMVGALAVVMPGNLLAISQREDTNLNVRAYGDGFHVLHLIVRHASRPKSPLAPMPRRNLLPVPPQPYSIAAGAVRHPQSRALGRLSASTSETIPDVAARARGGADYPTSVLRTRAVAPSAAVRSNYSTHPPMAAQRPSCSRT